MSDKSFGDHANRNIVKNPLLSTAVTGLSIEDLTHNAVLVPVAPNQTLVTGSDKSGSQIQTLAYTDHDNPTNPSGDSTTNIQTPLPSIPIHSHTLGHQTIHHHDKNPEIPSSTVSKALAKPEDDFDVNEYFARLQGTRYVSAPLHSHTDPNANLVETEENLEEINLNDDKTVEVQQSLTADIAQNFSQLPNVLPHVASAVFSSFSNMWNMKSREQTPDDRSIYQDVQFEKSQDCNQFQSNQGSSYQDIQFQGPPSNQYQKTPASNQFQSNQGSSYYGGQYQSQGFEAVSSVPLMSTEDVVKEVAPPPKEPPVCGISNFRLQTTKKKYAQIPGLTSTDAPAPQTAFNPLTQNVPSFFIPTDDSDNREITLEHSNINVETKQQTNESYNIFTPAEDTEPPGSHAQVLNQPELFVPPVIQQQALNQPQLFTPPESQQPSEKPPPINLQNQMPVIPPPPMFSGQRTDSQTGGKSVLPPSVARRIGSNHPVIKHQAVQPAFTPDNIFVPTFDSSAPPGPCLPPDTSQIPTYSSQMFVPTYQPLQQDQPVHLPPSSTRQASTYGLAPLGPPPVAIPAQALYQGTPAFMTSAHPVQMSSPSSVFGSIAPPPTANTIQPLQQDITASVPPSVTQVPSSSQASTGLGFKTIAPPPSSQDSSSQADQVVANVLPAGISGPQFFNPLQYNTPAIFTPGMPDTTSRAGSTSSSIPQPACASLPPSTGSVASEPISQSTLPSGPKPLHGDDLANVGPQIFAPMSTTPVVANIEPTIFTPMSTTSQNPMSGLTLPFVPKPSDFAPSNNGASVFTPNIAQTESQLSEPPKPLPEPPKAAGAASFRMTKKRPQYYSGPIEGFGSISNNVKPIIPTVDSGTFQGALFTPEQPQTDENKPSFDISDQVTTTTPYFDNTASNQTTATLYQAETTYPNFQMPQLSQDYNTAFDLSRPSDNNDKEETKGFGIIGSLKSKLVSLDINKIQNSVTNFFDPAYNDTKKDVAASQDNVPYNPEYQGQTQNNFEIFVPQAGQQQPYNYPADNSVYNPANHGYSNQYYPEQSGPYVGQSYGSQIYPTSPYTQQSQPNNETQTNLYTQQNTNEGANDAATSTDGITEASNNTAVKDTYIANVNVDSIPAEPTIIADEKVPATPLQSFFVNDPNLLQQAEVKEEEINIYADIAAPNITPNKPGPENMEATHNQMPGFNPYPWNDQYRNTFIKNPAPTAYLADTDPKILFEMAANYGFIPAKLFEGHECNMPTQPTPFEIKPSVKDPSKRKKSCGIPNYEMQYPYMQQLYRNVFKDEKQINIKSEEKETPNKDYFIESLNKDIPVVDVSSVPLFGLSTMIADKSNEIESDPTSMLSYEGAKIIEKLDNKASASFFENIPDQKCSELNDSLNLDTNASLNIVKKKEEIASSNLFDNYKNLETGDKSKNDAVILDRKSSKEIISTEIKSEIDRDSDSYIKDETMVPDDIENVSELSICETCREVSKTEEKETITEDLTKQLIENITAPIQLANPVEVPLPEDNNSERIEFDAGQFKKITHITEETIETLHVKSATELLEDNNIKMMNYGWPPDQKYATNPLTHPDYSYKVNPGAIGFFADPLGDNVPANASDELKAEFKHQEDLLPRQMSIPSAPPAEDDSKSDETGILDVNSIELDAKQDFPIFEEFVIEPSETDDDKIEYKERENTEESDLDSFTNRVEKFKKEKAVIDEPPIKYYDMPSQQITMASYFDTGNYAADTHYRNSLTSPSQISIPPGFEEEFRKRLALAKAMEAAKSVPETATQTKMTVSISYSSGKNTFSAAHSMMPVGFNVEENVTHIVEDSPEKLTESAFKFSSKEPRMLMFTSSYMKPPVTVFSFSAGEVRSETVSIIDSENIEAHGTTYILGSEDGEPLKISRMFGAQIPQLKPIKKPNSEEAEVIAANTDMFGSEAKIDAPAFTSSVAELIDSSLERHSPISYLFGAQVPKLRHINIPAVNDAETIVPPSNFFGSEAKIVPSIFNPSIADLIDPEEVATSIDAKIFDSTEDEPSKLLHMFGAQVPKLKPVNISSPEEAQAVAPAPNIIGSEANIDTPVVSEATSASNAIERPKIDENPTEPKLPDPINFFTDTATAPSENVSRLASYFSSPPKTDHAKSFFELSQSQNHYRHVTNTEKYQDLMKDLTSVQNLAVPTDQTIRHVNYFTVEYDAVEYHKGDNNKSKEKLVEKDDIDNKDTCTTCSSFIKGTFNVRQAMNDNPSPGSPNTMEDPNDPHRHSVTVNFDGVAMGDDAHEGVAVTGENRSSSEYSPVKHHWFYRVDVEDKSIWRGFSIVDSRALETAYLSPDLNEGTVVPTDGGRFDVNIVGRLRIPVYWIEKPTNVRRCSWFYKGTTDPRFVPYTEAVADKLEEEYHHGMTTGEWHRRMILPNGEVVVMHGPSVMVHFLSTDAFSSPPLFSFGKKVYRNPVRIRVSRDEPEKIDHLILFVHGAGEYKIQQLKTQSNSRPRVVRRGHDDSEIEDAEPSSIDHLLLLCHGVGSACDMRFRSVEEVVEDFRATSLQLVQSHYRNSYDQGVVSRVEVLPISWHSTLHSGETGVDRRLSQITLESIPRLRNFTNDTVLDVLFYTSPVFCQTIINTVCKELNRVYQLFTKRNPTFKGSVSLGGHSLGSVILYDLLCHQTPQEERRINQNAEKHYVAGPAGTGQPTVQYPSLHFEPSALYALGSPIAMFECIRGVESLGADFCLPTCNKFFNIFHPYDPIAYRIEPLIDPKLRDLKPFLIPHHKGRKRMHLELKDTMARVGADIKQKLMESLRSTWNKWKAQPNDGTLERVVEEEMEKEQLCDESKEQQAKEKELSTPQMLGHLNGGRRVDYVLQEAPLEMINEYLFAMSSHVGYWESEDTMLLMLREIYSSLGVQPDCTVPQQNMSVERTRKLDAPISNYPSTSSGAP